MDHIPPPPTIAELPLSVLVDRLGGGLQRNEEFVRRLSDWLHERADRLTLDAVDVLGLTDVVLTFRMKGTVTLVATGRFPNRPGEVQIRWREEDFPALRLVARRDPRPDPYQVCTLDYSVEGRPVVVGGVPGKAAVLATINGVPRVRVLLEGRPDPVEADPDVLASPPPPG
jgi:hypothetical protein